MRQLRNTTGGKNCAFSHDLQQFNYIKMEVCYNSITNIVAIYLQKKKNGQSILAYSKIRDDSINLNMFCVWAEVLSRFFDSGKHQRRQPNSPFCCCPYIAFSFHAIQVKQTSTIARNQFILSIHTLYSPHRDKSKSLLLKTISQQQAYNES